MAFDVKGAFAQTLLELCEHKELSKITINDLEKNRFQQIDIL